jgi:hypothetical protein
MEKVTQWLNLKEESLLMQLNQFDQADGMPKQEPPITLGGVFRSKGYFCCWVYDSTGRRMALGTAFTLAVGMRQVEQYLMNIKQFSYYENNNQKAA